MRNVSDFTHIEVHVVKPLVSGLILIEVATVTSVSIRIRAGGEILLSAILKLINYIWNEEELYDG
jgi:hypothetical protein